MSGQFEWRRGRPLAEILDLRDTLDVPSVVSEHDHADFYRKIFCVMNITLIFL